MCDFDPSYFALGWNQWYAKHSDTLYCGHTIVFPLKVTLYMHRSPPNGYFKNSDGTFTAKPRPLVETLRIELVKENC